MSFDTNKHTVLFGDLVEHEQIPEAVWEVVSARDAGMSPLTSKWGVRPRVSVELRFWASVDEPNTIVRDTWWCDAHMLRPANPLLVLALAAV